ncbi:MAG TPA: hypothetical protein VF951_08385 [Streptosporangiaceae bacterium]
METPAARATSYNVQAGELRSLASRSRPATSPFRPAAYDEAAVTADHLA